MSSVDPAATKTISDMYEIQGKQGVQVLFVACPSSVLEVMDHCKLFSHVNVQYFYPSIEHALLFVGSADQLNNGLGQEHVNCPST